MRHQHPAKPEKSTNPALSDHSSFMRITSHNKCNAESFTVDLRGAAPVASPPNVRPSAVHPARCFQLGAVETKRVGPSVNSMTRLFGTSADKANSHKPSGFPCPDSERVTRALRGHCKKAPTVGKDRFEKRHGITQSHSFADSGASQESPAFRVDAYRDLPACGGMVHGSLKRAS